MNEPKTDGGAEVRADKGTPGPELKTPPEAKAGSGSEPSIPERPSKPRIRKTRIEGARRLSCRRCDHFLGEVKSEDFEFLTTCHRCKTENHFAFTGLR